ncbi:MAG: aminopeptidase P family protein [Lachnospiraceae bacterium]|nr:aminopeptidase P family protein [Lachnospiraceae bacterium]
MEFTRLLKLRGRMMDRGIDIAIVPTADYHGSEYVSGYFKSRAWLTGFTGSAGVAAATLGEAGLWTDGRYFIQARREIEGSGFRLFPMGTEGVPTVNEFVDSRLTEGGTVGFDGRTVDAAWGLELERIVNKHHGTLICDEDLMEGLWEDRPALPCEPVWILPEKYAGESASDKLSRVRKEMESRGASVHILTSLDDIAWLLNLRGGDVPNCPVFLSYLLLTLRGCILYTHLGSLSEEVREYLLKNGVRLAPYEDFYGMLELLSEKPVGGVLLNSASVNYRIFSTLRKHARIIDSPNPSFLMKAVKNETELRNIRNAHVKDGIAMVRWLYWLKNAVSRGESLTEITVSDRLAAFRKEGEGYLGPSFSTICAYGENAAMMHYKAEPDSCARVLPEGFLLVDSGGHYLEGSTDITRTVVMGPLTDVMKRWFTLALKSNLRLANAKFLYGLSGLNLDILARGPLWDQGVDYRCGTGHGIGYLLNVHEGPNGFRYKKVAERNDSAVLEEGMVTTDEPGVYFEGRFGIRHENELITRVDETNEYGRFMSFETVTYCPFDLSGVDLTLLSDTEKRWLNDYHRMVYDTLAPHLPEAERWWLRYETREI